MLTLFEEFYLLTLDDEKGNLVWFARKSFAFLTAGLILAELALVGKLGMGEKVRLVVLDEHPTGDPILDDTLEQIRSAEKLRKPSYWVSQLSADPKKLKQSIGQRLVEKKILIQDEKRFYRQEITPGSELPMPDKYQFKKELRGLVFVNNELDLRNMALLNMIAAANLLTLLFTQDEIETAEKVIQRQLLATAMGNPVMELVEEIVQAVSSVIEDELE